MKIFKASNFLKISIILLKLFLCQEYIFSQNFAPQAGFPGTTAIYKDSSVFVDWAIACRVHRGFINIANNDTTTTNFGSDSNAIGPPGGTMDVVSLGDGGYAIVSFNYPIVDGQGYDFAVFENGFKDANNPYMAFLELAFVEVSEDGKKFYRFPAVSNTPTNEQIGTFEKLDARYIHNLAGKYIANYGTPFDLAELKNIYPQLNVNNINYIKIIDVVGAINSPFTQTDYYGNPINDPYPTPFASGGFDLDAVGVIHNLATKNNKNFLIYPNPVKDILIIKNIKSQSCTIQIFTVDGRLIKQLNSNTTIYLPINETFKPFFIVRIYTNQICIIKKIISI